MDRATSYVLCLKNRRYPAALEIRKIYETVPDPEAATRGLIRVIDESGEDYLYPADRFVEVDLPNKARPAIAKSVTGSV